MFCGNCGKEIIDTKFCPYCGAEQTAVVIPAASIPISVPISELKELASEAVNTSASAHEFQSEAAYTSIPDPEIQSEPVNQSAPSAETPSTETGELPELAGLPTPNPIPTGNIDMPETTLYTSAPGQPFNPMQSAQPVQSALSPQAAQIPSTPQVGVFMSEIAIRDEEKPDNKNKYSLKHIVMCLAAAAVMAVVAGVFAGLYFSVILS